MPAPPDALIRRLRPTTRTWLDFRKEPSIDERRWRARVAPQLGAAARRAQIIRPATIRRSAGIAIALWPTPYRAGQAWTSLVGPVIDDVIVRLRAIDQGAGMRQSAATWLAVRSTPLRAARGVARLAAPLMGTVARAVHRILAAAGAQVGRSIARWSAVRRAMFIGAATRASNRMVSAAGASVGGARGSVTGWIAVRRAPFSNIRSWKTLAAPIVDAVHSSGAQTAVGLGIGLAVAVVFGLFFAAPVPAASIPTRHGPQVAVAMSGDRVELTIRDASKRDAAPVIDVEAARTPEPVAPTRDPASTSTEPPRAPAASQRPATRSTPPPTGPAETQRPAASSPPATVEAEPAPTPTPDPGSENEKKPPRADKPGKPEKPDKPPKSPKPPKPG